MIGGWLRVLNNWYSERPLRERLLLLGALLVLVLLAWDQLVYTPLAQRQRKLQGQIAQVRVTLDELAVREAMVEAQKIADPDQENRQRMSALQAELDRLEPQLAQQVLGLVPPREMPELLKRLLLKQQKLQLLSLENLPAEEVKLGSDAADGQFSTGLYRHPLRVELAGNYLSTLNYLRELQQLPRALIWEELEIETQDYPQARVRLQISTLSLDRGWIGG
jgi:MSHA biogenesis protein MshJ